MRVNTDSRNHVWARYGDKFIVYLDTKFNNVHGVALSDLLEEGIGMRLTIQIGARIGDRLHAHLF